MGQGEHKRGSCKWCGKLSESGEPDKDICKVCVGLTGEGNAPDHWTPSNRRPKDEARLQAFLELCADQEYGDCTDCRYAPKSDDKRPCEKCLYNNPLCFKIYYYPTEEAITRELQNEVVHPAHYQGRHECLDEMVALFGMEAVKSFCRCNVFKYRFRAAAKNGQEDLEKAENYMEILMRLEAGKPWK